MKVVLHIYVDVATEAEGLALKQNILNNLPHGAVDILVPESDPDIVPEPIEEPPSGN